MESGSPISRQVPIGADAISVRQDAGECTGSFVGRRRELIDFAGVLERARNGYGQALALVGEPGIGKTELARELSRMADAHDSRVIWSRCIHTPPDACEFWAWRQIFRDLSGRFAIEAAPCPSVPDCRGGNGYRTAADRADSDQRYGRFEAVSDTLAAVSEKQPLVLVFDDIDSADNASLALLTHVCNHLVDTRIVVIVTYRSFHGRAGSAFGKPAPQHLIPHARLVPLAPLSREEIRDMVQASGRSPVEELVGSLSRMSGGNPRLLELLLKSGPDPAGRNAVLPGLRGAVAQHMLPLSEPARELLATASVIGEVFELALLRSVSPLEPASFLDCLSEIQRAELVAECVGSPGRYHFWHSLIRETLYGELPGARRAMLHHRIGNSIEELACGATSAVPLIAEHLFRSAVLCDASKASDYCERAADLAAADSKFEQASRFYRSAIAAAAIDGGCAGQRRARLWLRLGKAQHAAGDIAGSRESLQSAAEIAEKFGDHELCREALAAINLLFAGSCSMRIATAPELKPAGVNGDTAAAGSSRDDIPEPATAGAESPACNNVAPEAAADSARVFRKEGDYWTIAFNRKVIRLKNSKGLSYIARLLRNPGRDFHAAELTAGDHESVTPRIAASDLRRLTKTPTPSRSVGSILDRTAKTQYKERLIDLREELDQARANNDVGRVERLEQELEFVSGEFARAHGLTGRDRRWPSDAEHARVNVCNAIRSVVKKIMAENDALGRYLSGCIRTGYLCSFKPDPRFPEEWEF